MNSIGYRIDCLEAFGPILIITDTQVMVSMPCITQRTVCSFILSFVLLALTYCRIDEIEKLRIFKHSLYFCVLEFLN